ncbi:MAG: DUF423 domain-containing protein [Cytophagaceae bacterium]|jgi:uncharacterized membrane protein YgdD (TMEM256/DUF423 family)|nr:DUF423 domain-containing protein [Cytophagaceae bacterium]
MVKFFLLAASLLGGLSVGIGAFGAHAWAPFLKDTGRLETFETAVRYQFYHTLALLACGILLQLFSQKYFHYAGLCFLGGIFIFSGSLYILCATQVKTWGAVTPLGGLLFIAGWICLALGIWKGAIPASL